MAPLLVTPDVACAWGGWRRTLRSGVASAVLVGFLVGTPLAVVAVVVRVASDHALTGTGGIGELARSDVVALAVALAATCAWLPGALAAFGELRGRDRPVHRSRLVPLSMQRVVAEAVEASLWGAGTLAGWTATRVDACLGDLQRPGPRVATVGEDPVTSARARTATGAPGRDVVGALDPGALMPVRLSDATGAPRPAMVVHVVGRGETWWALAQQFLGRRGSLLRAEGAQPRPGPGRRRRGGPGLGAASGLDHRGPRGRGQAVTGRWQALVAGLVAAVVLAGCSGDENTLTQAGPSQEPGSSVPGEPFDVDDPELEAALAAFFEEFLAAWDRHRTPGQGAGPAASGLAELASPAVVAEADAWRAANEALGESFERVVSVESTANIVDVAVEGPVASIEDCTAEVETWAPGSSGIPTVLETYGTRAVEVSRREGDLMVEEVEITHAGRIDSPGYACVPEDLAEQAEVVVEEMLGGLRALQADPRGGVGEDLAALMADPFESEITSSLAEQAELGYAITSPTDQDVAAMGIDPRGLGSPVVVVRACATYPEGLVLSELASGAVLRQVFPPGAGDEVLYAVRMDATDGPEVYELVSETLPTQC